MNNQPSNLDKKLSFNYPLFSKYAASLLGGLGLLSSGLIWTQLQAQAVGNDLVIPDHSSAGSSESSSPVAPVNPKPVTETKSSPSQPPTTAPKTQLSAPKISAPETSVEPASSLIMPQIQPTAVNPPTVNIETGKNSYIDTTQYAQPQQKNTTSTTVVLKERSSGCQTIAENGQLSSGQCQGSVVAKSPTASAPVQTSSPQSSSRRVRNISNVATNPPQRQVNNRSTPLQPRPVTQSQVVSLKPIEMQGIKVALAPVPRYNRATVMQEQLTPVRRKTDLIFPLSIPARISSAFGWRVHPISQTVRMHEGTDIAAPMGTPVLAAYEGEVALADWAGGYGLMVILRHLDGSQESRYAHLSEIYVQPGEWVEQGTVIGRVGSTGASTGPHLHFEWRHHTEQGWVAVDAGLHLEFALENLIQNLQTAQNNTQQQG